MKKGDTKLSTKIDTKITTRYCESDALGHINSVSYYIYIEQARVEFLKASELTPNINNNWPYVLVSSKCDYKNQLFIDETIIIYSSVSDIGESSFTLTHQIIREKDDLLIANGNSIIVYFDYEKQISEKLTIDIINKLSTYEV